MRVSEQIMDFWPEFLASNWGREFVAGGFGGVAGVISGQPLDTIRIQQQSSNAGSATSIFRHIVAKEGPAALFRGMAAPLASVTFQVTCSHHSAQSNFIVCSFSPFFVSL